MQPNDLIYRKAAQMLGMPEELIKKIYTEYWKEIRRLVTQDKIVEGMSEEEFNRTKRNVTIQGLGKLSCTYQQYLRKIHNIKSRTKYYEDQKDNSAS